MREAHRTAQVLDDVSDHLGEVLRRADALLAEWSRFGDAVRMEVERRIILVLKKSGNLLHSQQGDKKMSSKVPFPPPGLMICRLTNKPIMLVSFGIALPYGKTR